MVTNQLKLGSELMYYGKKYKVISIEPPSVLINRSEGDGETISVNFYQLVTNPSFRPGKLMVKEIEADERKYESVLDSLSEERRKIVSFRLQMVKPILLLEKVKQNDFRSYYEFTEFHGKYLNEGESPYDLTQEELINRISKRYSEQADEADEKSRGVSVRTIKRYLAKVRKLEAEYGKRGEEALVTRAGEGQMYRKDNKQLHICHPQKPGYVLDTIQTRLDEVYLPILKQAIEKKYLTLKKPTKKHIYDEIQIQCLKQGIEPPKWITVMKLLDRVSERVQVRMRLGEKAAEQFNPVDRGFSNEEAMYPHHIVQIDHTQLDLDVIDEHGNTVGRPWITMGIDVFSRMVWCLYISFEPPSAAVVRKAIQHGIFFKHTKEKYNTLNEWEVAGIPSIFFMDNGSDFRSNEIKRLIRETLRSEVRYRPVTTPRFGAVIERLFGTINREFIHRCDGTRKSNTRELGEYDPNQEAKLTIDDVRLLLTWYITDIYHMKEHRGLPLDANIPMIRYVDGLKKAGYPDFIAPDQERDLSIELLPTVLKPYTRDGVRLDHVLYKSSALRELVGNGTVKYKVKYDIDDISRIYLLPPDSTEYIEVTAYQPSADTLVGVNRYVWKHVKELMKSLSEWKSSFIPGTQQVAQALVRLQDEVQARYKKGRKARQQAQRMNYEVTVTPAQTTTKSTSVAQISIQDRLERAREVAAMRLRNGGQ